MGWLLLVLMLLLILFPHTRTRIAELAREGREAPAVASRQWMSRVAITMWSERPWTGWGGGAYALMYTERLGDVLPMEKTHHLLRQLVHAREAHQALFQFGAEFGIIGVLLATVFLVGVVRVLLARSRDDPLRYVGLFILAYMFVVSSVSFPWQAAVAGPMAGIWLGWLVASERETRTKKNGFLASGGMIRASSLLLGVAFSIFSWSDARLNLAVPRLIERGASWQAAAVTPVWGHKYLALCGADMAARGQHHEAMLLLEEAHHGYRDALLLNNLGHVYAMLGRPAQAVALYTTWCRSGIEHRKALDNYSVALEQAGDYAGAAERLERRIVLWPDRDAVELARLAMLYHRAGHLDRVLWTIRELRPRTGLPVNKLTPETMNLMAASLIQFGCPAEAFFWLELALEQNPGLLSARKNLEALQIQGIVPPGID